jgi:hypothetical protein
MDEDAICAGSVDLVDRGMKYRLMYFLAFGLFTLTRENHGEKSKAYPKIYIKSL